MRPLIGFIVEGDGEWQSYRSVVARTLGIANPHIPIVNARGIGNVFSDLEENLGFLIGNDHPHDVLVTCDMTDAIEAGGFEECKDVRCHLEDRIDRWRRNRGQQKWLEPLPHRIKVVIQVKAFETWWLADLDGLAELDEFDFDRTDFAWGNVDEEVTNPGVTLGRLATPGVNLKSPRLAKSVFGSISPERASCKSRSFDKFKREIQNSYDDWLRTIDDSC